MFANCKFLLSTVFMKELDLAMSQGVKVLPVLHVSGFDESDFNVAHKGVDHLTLARWHNSVKKLRRVQVVGPSTLPTHQLVTQVVRRAVEMLNATTEIQIQPQWIGTEQMQDNVDVSLPVAEKSLETPAGDPIEENPSKRSSVDDGEHEFRLAKRNRRS